MRSVFAGAVQFVPTSFLYFLKGFVFVGGGAADVADPCQFADVQLPVFVDGIAIGDDLHDNRET